MKYIFGVGFLSICQLSSIAVFVHTTVCHVFVLKVIFHICDHFSFFFLANSFGQFGQLGFILFESCLVRVKMNERLCARQKSSEVILKIVNLRQQKSIRKLIVRVLCFSAIGFFSFGCLCADYVRNQIVFDTHACGRVVYTYFLSEVSPIQ